MESIVLIDAYAQIYRCFFAIRAGLTNPQGTPVNALYGIARFLLQLERTLPSAFGAVVFDKGKAVRRLEVCPLYKAQRPPMPPDMRPQIPLIREWMAAFGWPLLEEEGLEADDIIAAIARRRGEHPVLIVTHDKDISQLTADKGVRLAHPEKNDTWNYLDAAGVEEKYGVPPAQIRDYLALVGDTADNIQGVSGIGPKRAAKMLREFGSIEEILKNPDAAGGKTLGPVLRNSEELLKRNQFLTSLADQLPSDCPLPPVRHTPDWEKIFTLIEENGFHSLLAPAQKCREASPKAPPTPSTEPEKWEQMEFF